MEVFDFILDFISSLFAYVVVGYIFAAILPALIFGIASFFSKISDDRIFSWWNMIMGIGLGCFVGIEVGLEKESAIVLRVVFVIIASAAGFLGSLTGAWLSVSLVEKLKELFRAGGANVSRLVIAHLVHLYSTLTIPEIIIFAKVELYGISRHYPPTGAGKPICP
jgi:hypothetical protein